MANSSSSSCLPSSPCPLSLAVACAPSVCRLVCFVAVRRVVSFLFLAGVAVCFVCSVCGGCAWGVLCFFRHCLLNECVLRRKVPSQHASPERLLFFVPSSCLVACRRSVRWCCFFLVFYGSDRFMVGARVRCACCCGLCVCTRACACKRVCATSWDSGIVALLLQSYC